MGAYRGAGRPEANYFMERLIDRAADEMGIDRFELRKRNLHQAVAAALAAASGVTYDSGDFQGVFDQGAGISDHEGLRRRKKDSRKQRGKLRGIAVGSYLEVTAPPSEAKWAASASAKTAPSRIITGTLDYGQGHWTPFAQVLTSSSACPSTRSSSCRATATS
jgi:carbon-monoxide dehydrogenase large subunit